MVQVKEATAPAEQKYYIHADSERTIEKPLVLKHDNLFGVFDHFGDVNTEMRQEAGVYYRDTRFLSRFLLRFAGARPLLLSSTVRRDNIVLATDLTNPDLYSEDGQVLLARGSLHIYRGQYLWDGVLYHLVRITNYTQASAMIQLSLEFAADFVDIFQVRGTPRERSGLVLPPRQEGDAIWIEYQGLDNVNRRTILRCPSKPEALGPEGLRYFDVLEPGGERTIEVNVTMEMGRESIHPRDYSSRLSLATKQVAEPDCDIFTSNEQFNLWLSRSQQDLRMLTTRTEEGDYPYAGIPWFSTPFGRDAIITALECLWLNPSLARGVLLFLTKTQAAGYSPVQDAEPGKILHEARDGEMAAVGEVPFGRYYGSVDATPLYLMLASEYFHRTGDRELLSHIWGGVQKALAWIDGDGDKDGDGFVEYNRQAESGLVQQGWKDSHDSVFHKDGTLADAPIALCEVQAYVYAAKSGLARAAAALGFAEEAAKLTGQARTLRQRFEDAFWSPSIESYAIALDGKKRRCEVRNSNAGHALYCGISNTKSARAIADTFLEESFYSGWGVRTIAEGEARYNPMAYHNGSIWPHDNAMIAAGFARYGFTDLAERIMTGLFQAAVSLELSRLPELFCGFRRRHGKSPTWYPTACAPQAWAAGAAYLLLQSSLGLSVEALEKRVVMRHPRLPDYLERVSIRNLRVGEASIDIRVFRSDGGAAVTVERRVGEVDVMVLR